MTISVSSPVEALGIVTRYFDESRLVPKTRLALSELLLA